MRRFTILCLAICLLASCSKYRVDIPAEFRAELTSVSGSNARITVAALNPDAYYIYFTISEYDPDFDMDAMQLCLNEMEIMKESMVYFSKESFTDIFCQRGSRQFSLDITGDTEFKFILFQINPRNLKILGDPIVVQFHTLPLANRDMHFDVKFEGSTVTITPTTDEYTYFWDYDAKDIVLGYYPFPISFLSSLIDMYDEYGFLDSMYSKGTDVWDFSNDKALDPGDECVMVICGCENGSVTTLDMTIIFRYNPGNIEVLNIIDNTYDAPEGGL